MARSNEMQAREMKAIGGFATNRPTIQIEMCANIESMDWFGKATNEAWDTMKPYFKNLGNNRHEIKVQVPKNNRGKNVAKNTLVRNVRKWNPTMSMTQAKKLRNLCDDSMIHRDEYNTEGSDLVTCCAVHAILHGIETHYGLNKTLPIIGTASKTNTRYTNRTTLNAAERKHAAYRDQLKAAIEGANQARKGKAAVAALKALLDDHMATGPMIHISNKRSGINGLENAIRGENSDALEPNLQARMTQEGRQTKALPQARILRIDANGQPIKRVAAAITSAYDYQGRGKQRKKQYWCPLNLPIIDPLTGRFWESRGKVRLARTEVRVGYINDTDEARWEARFKNGSSNRRVYGSIVQVAVDMGDDVLAVWAVLADDAQKAQDDAGAC